MYLLSIKDIDNFFTSFFEKLAQTFTWQTLFILLTGIILGFVICSTIYGVLIITSLNAKEHVRIDKELNLDTDETKIKQDIEIIKQNFVKETDGLTIKERFESLGPAIMETVNIVASSYYPHSKYPLYELSISELILFLRYLSYRIEKVFDSPVLRPFKNMTISQIIKIIDIQKKINENKVVKTINNPVTNKFKKIMMGIVNYANPIYWIKKLVMGTTINLAIKKICLVVIDIVGDETNKTYSKAIFNQERTLYQEEIEQTINNIEGDND